MLFHPSERNVYPFLVPTRNRCNERNSFWHMAIHDKDVTVAKPARVLITVWTGLALPFEERPSTKAHRDIELRFPTLSKQRLISSLACLLVTCCRCE